MATEHSDFQHPGVRWELVERAVEAYGTVVKSSRGHAIFLSGEELNGQRETVEAIKAAIEREQPRPFMIRGSFAGGTYEAYESEPGSVHAKEHAFLASYVMQAAGAATGSAAGIPAAIFAVWAVTAQ